MAAGDRSSHAAVNVLSVQPLWADFRCPSMAFPGAMTGCDTPPCENPRRGSGSHPGAPRTTDARTSTPPASCRSGNSSRAGGSAGSQPDARGPRLPARPRRRWTAAGAGSGAGDGEAAPRRTGRGRRARPCPREARLPLARRLEPRADRGRSPSGRRMGPRVAGAPRAAATARGGPRGRDLLDRGPEDRRSCDARERGAVPRDGPGAQPSGRSRR